MPRILPLAAALLSLASIAPTASAAGISKPSDFGWKNRTVIAGCDGIDWNNPAGHYPCERGGYITIEKKHGVPTAVWYSDPEPPARSVPVLTTQLARTPNGYMPRAPRPLAAGERFYCQPEATYQICGFNNNPTNKFAWYDSAYYNLDGTPYGQGPSGFVDHPGSGYAAQGTVDQQIKIASFQARPNTTTQGREQHDFRMTKEITQGGGEQLTVDVRHPSVGETLVNKVLVPGLQAFSFAGAQRLAYGENAGYGDYSNYGRYYYGSYVPSGPYLYGGSRGGCDRITGRCP
jgi:hypothetical protein